MYNASNLNSMKRIVYMLAVLFYGTSLFAQDKPFDIEHAPAPLFRCPIYDGPTDPTLEWNAERQEWWMFYTQRRANVPNLEDVVQDSRFQDEYGCEQGFDDLEGNRQM